MSMQQKAAFTHAACASREATKIGSIRGSLQGGACLAAKGSAADPHFMHIVGAGYRQCN
jgi:hypothetical protein